MSEVHGAAGPSEDEIIAAIRAVRGRNGVAAWATTWDVIEHLGDFAEVAVVEKLRDMVDREAIGGCACSLVEPYCRGDFEIREDDEVSA